MRCRFLLCGAAIVVLIASGAPLLAQQPAPKAGAEGASGLKDQPAYKQMVEARRANNHAKVVELATQVLADTKLSSSDRVNTLMLRGEQQGLLGKLDEGKADYDEAVRIAGTANSKEAKDLAAEALRQRAALLRDFGRYDAAIADYEASDKASGRPAQTIHRARTLALKGDLDGAVRVLDQALTLAKAASDKASVLSERAWVRVRQGKTVEALVDADEANRADPKLLTSSSNPRAWIQAELGRYEDAVATLIQAERASDAKQAAVYSYVRAYIEAARGRYDDALKAMASTAGEQSGNVSVQVALHLARLRAGQAANPALEAIAAKADAAKWPEAQSLFLLGKIDRAKLEEAAKHPNPRQQQTRSCQFHFIAGAAALTRGETEAARQDFTRATEVCATENVALHRIWAKGELGRLPPKS